MLKKVIGVVVGFLVWTVLWIGSEFVIKAVAPDLAPDAELTYVTDTYLVLKLILSIIFSLVSGYLAASLSADNRNSPLILGLLLLFVGIGVQSAVWSVLPLWYHLSFLTLLLPATVFGGRVRRIRD